jgi:hypothetical protein
VLARAAFSQDALVEIARGDAGSALELLAEGIGARLRFAVPLQYSQPLPWSTAGAVTGIAN